MKKNINREQAALGEEEVSQLKIREEQKKDAKVAQVKKLGQEEKEGEEKMEFRWERSNHREEDKEQKKKRR